MNLKLKLLCWIELPSLLIILINLEFPGTSSDTSDPLFYDLFFCHRILMKKAPLSERR